MLKLELLVALVRAIDNSPAGKFTLSGPENSGGGDLERVSPGVIRHSDRYTALVEVGRSRAYAEMRKYYEPPENSFLGAKHPDPPTPEECVAALFEDALVRAEKLRRELQAHADLLARALEATGRDVSDVK